MSDMLVQYARLLAHYSLEIRPNEKVGIRATTLAEPLVRELYREILAIGAMPFVWWEFAGEREMLSHGVSEWQQEQVHPIYEAGMTGFDAWLVIDAPFNLRDPMPKRGGDRHRDLAKLYSERTAVRNLKRSLCIYPTDALAQNAGMTLEQYRAFVYKACYLYDENPAERWLQVRADQQRIVDHLNRCRDIHYRGEGIDIRFSTEGRVWINSDGRTNMPSGEVYTSPVEDSVNGTIHFTYPIVYGGEEVEGVTLWVKDGHIERWEARKGIEKLDWAFSLPGARRFGEAAIGTNYNIDRFTKSILFDEKIGGTVHLAIGQSYLQTGGKNESPIHWDLIADMKNGGEILADGETIYRNGAFLLP
jgi:aminopeptidase